MAPSGAWSWAAGKPVQPGRISMDEIQDRISECRSGQPVSGANDMEIIVHLADWCIQLHEQVDELVALLESERQAHEITNRCLEHYERTRT